MPINRVELKDFLVFNDEFTLDFCSGINVLIGGNGTGKTTLLKAMYGVCDNSVYQFTKEIPIDRYNRGNSFSDYFYDGSTVIVPVMESLYGVSSSIPNDKKCLITYNGNTFGYRYPTIEELKKMEFSDEKIAESKFLWIYYGSYPTELDGVDKPYIQSVLIPTEEALSHSKGFLALNNERKMPFDQTFINVLSKAELPVTRIVTPNAVKILDKIKTIIGGEVVYENDIFYVEKENGAKIPFALEASGFKKVGLLWKLLRNGLLESGTTLLWDEPENSLNPELIPELVDILLELSRNGVQIFIATHSEILASYFTVNRMKGDSVMFYSLYKNGDSIGVNSDDRFDLLEPNNLKTEIVNLYEKEIERGLGGNG